MTTRARRGRAGRSGAGQGAARRNGRRGAQPGVPEVVQASLDRLVMSWMAEEARKKLPARDKDAALSALLSELAGGDLADRVPDLAPEEP